MLLTHVVVAVMCSATLPLLAMLLLRLKASLNARARVASELQRLRELQGKDGTVIVTGTLRVEGPVEEYKQSPVGALTRWSGMRRFSLDRTTPSVGRERAQRLVVMAGAQRVELQGPVEVLAGSMTTFERGRSGVFDRPPFLVRASLADGDEVTVAGKGDRSSEGDSGELILEPLEASGVIFACALATTTRVSRKSLVGNLVVVPLMLLGCLPLFGLVSDSTSTECLEECRRDGRCGTTSNFVSGPWRDGLARVLNGDHVECGANEDASCRASTACRKEGRCTAVAGRCVAATSEDCRAATICLELGFCSPVEGACLPATEEDCLYTEGCVSLGRCTPRDGACLVVNDVSCAATRDCTQSGTCSARGGKCVAATREDCSKTWACREKGRCTPSDGVCHAANDEDCRSSQSCVENGMCSFKDGLCVAKTPADCVGSRRCAAARECLPKEGHCVVDATTCRGSAACAHWGRCDGDDLCAAREKVDCANAEVCRDKPACRVLEGSCAASCRETETCWSSGECTDHGQDACVAASSADCIDSSNCLSIAFCTAENGRCTLKSSADCTHTTGCRDRSACTLKDMSCVVGAADCAASLACKRLGQCSPSTVWSQCEATTADCENAEVCSKFGWCAPDKALGSITPKCGPSPRQ